ncbi:hypothetical protein OAD57_04280 [Porticoccaceae bacterium]|nr:hypothetical protein [Porticoccaceae bacterium]
MEEPFLALVSVLLSSFYSIRFIASYTKKSVRSLNPMISRNPLKLAPILFISGCSLGPNSDEVMVDLAGGVFLVFMALVAIKYVTPKLVRNASFERLLQHLEKNISSFIKPLYGISFLLVLYGFLSPILTGNILDKILVFPGFVFAIIARNIVHIAKKSGDEERKRLIEITSLGLSVIAVFFILWLLGDEMFDPFKGWF